MRWEVRYTARAKQDLRDILDYISHDLQEPETAVRLVRKITAEISALAQMPMRHRLYEEEPWRSRGLRWFPVKNYLVFYWVEEETTTVYAARILYGRRDIPEQLKKERRP